jgi:tartrate dehydratase beta subunit/fumarate hydratase class I family protein
LFLSEIRELRSEIKQLRSENQRLLETVTAIKVKAALLVTFVGGCAGILGEAVRKKLGL